MTAVVLLAALAFEPGRFTMLNIVPFSPGAEERAAADCREYAARTGQRDCLYSLTLHPEGVPAIEKVERAVESYRRFATALEGSDVRPGILLQAIVGHWPRTDKEIEPWQRTIDATGRAVRFCPLDPRFNAYIREVGRRLAETHPSCIMSDDDVRAYSPQAECFCPLHVAEYNRRTGGNFTGETLRAHVAALPVGAPGHRAFTDMMFETTRGVVEALRAGIDSVDPSVSGGACMPGWVWERSRAHLNAETMGGSGRAFLRLADGTYTEDAPKFEFAPGVLRTLAMAERVRNCGFAGALLVEADTCPQNLWAKSAAAFHANLAYAAFAGLDGAKVWYVNQRRKGIPVTRHYTDVLAAHRGYYDAIAQAVRGTDWLGAVTPCYRDFPVSNALELKHPPASYDSRTWGDHVFGAFGIPFCVSENLDRADAVYAISGSSMAARLSDDDWRKVLSHKALLDGDAVREALARGFGDLIGVKPQDNPVRFTCERERGSGLEAALPESAQPVLMSALSGAETLSDLIWRKYSGAAGHEVAGPASLLFTNRIGGTVVSMCYHMRMGPYSQYSETRKRILISALRRLDPATVENACLVDQNVTMLARRTKDGSALLHVFNVNYDKTDNLSFVQAVRPARVSRLAPNGVWEAVAFDWRDRTLMLDMALPFYGEAMLKIERAQ